jgi:hypothetical protein
MQVFFAHAPGVRNSAGRIGHGLDIRGDGGYVVAPPSVVAEGGRSGTYEWIVPPTVPLAPMPGWLLALILRAQGPATSGTPRYDRGRNDALFRMARALHWRRRSEAEISDTVRMENLEKCHPPLSQHEMDKILESALSYPPDWERADVPNPEHERWASPPNIQPNSEGPT